MSSITFDHTKDKLSLSMDISQKEYQEIQNKTKNYVKLLINDYNSKKSHLAQKIAEELSYKELVFFSTSFVIMSAEMAKEGIKKMREKNSFEAFESMLFGEKQGNNEDLMKIIQMLKDLKNPNKNSEE